MSSHLAYVSAGAFLPCLLIPGYCAAHPYGVALLGLHSSWRGEATRNERRPHQTLLCALIHNRAAEFESRNFQWIVISGIVAMDAREAAGYMGPGLCSDATVCITCPCCSAHVSQFPQLPKGKCSLHRIMEGYSLSFKSTSSGTRSQYSYSLFQKNCCELPHTDRRQMLGMSWRLHSKGRSCFCLIAIPLPSLSKWLTISVDGEENKLKVKEIKPACFNYS